MKKWEKVSEEILHKNPWWIYKHEKYVLPNGKEGDYYYVHVLGMTIIIPVLDDGKIAMTEQYRYLFGKNSIEFPGGGKKEGKTLEENARDELREETGYEAGEIKLVGSNAPYNGVSDQMSSIFLATKLKKIGSSPEETEEIKVLHKAPEEIDRMIENNEIWDGETIAAWGLARKHFIK